MAVVVFIWLFMFYRLLVFSTTTRAFWLPSLAPRRATGSPLLSTKPTREGAGLWLWWFSYGDVWFLVVLCFLITIWEFSSTSLAPRRATGSPHPGRVPGCGGSGPHVVIFIFFSFLLTWSTIGGFSSPSLASLRATRSPQAFRKTIQGGCWAAEVVAFV